MPSQRGGPVKGDTPSFQAGNVPFTVKWTGLLLLKALGQDDANLMTFWLLREDMLPKAIHHLSF